MAGIILVGSRIHMAKDTVPINYITLDWSIIHRSHAETPKFFAGRPRPVHCGFDTKISKSLFTILR